MSQSVRPAFIVGSPRSGTTILGNILEAHPMVAHLYEPYYIWYYHAKDLSTDCIRPEDIGAAEQQWIRKQFERFAAGMGRTLVVDKSPELSLNLPIVQAVFPDAKFIHILRDGRDVVLSIKKEWEKRQGIVEDRSFGRLFGITNSMLKRQPLWRFRRLAIWYELKTSFSLNPRRYLNKAKWEGKVGWGPRFEGWKEVLEEGPLIRFFANQWLRCVEQIETHLPKVPEENRFSLRYEDLVSENHREVIGQVLQFLDLPATQAFWDRMPAIKVGNKQKWSKELSSEEIHGMGPVLSEKLIQLAYDKTDSWYAA